MLLAMGMWPRDACMSAALKNAWLMSETASAMPAVEPELRSRSHSKARVCTGSYKNAVSEARASVAQFSQEERLKSVAARARSPAQHLPSTQQTAAHPVSTLNHSVLNAKLQAKTNMLGYTPAEPRNIVRQKSGRLRSGCRHARA
jgi:hypothetical protein